MTDKPKDSDGRQELAKVWLPVPDDDESNRKGYRWPASHLTSADMEKLTQLRERTGRPITVLIHEAVSVLFELTRSDMAKLEQLRDRTGLSIKELLTQAVHFMYDAETSNDKYRTSETESETPLRVHAEESDAPPTDAG